MLTKVRSRDGDAVAADFSSADGSPLVQNRETGQWFGYANGAVMPLAPLNARGFGATGNGSTDDTSAIQDAIDHMASLGGGYIWFSRGRYLITTITLKANVRLIGECTTPQATTDGVVFLGSGSGTMVDTPVGSTSGCGMQGIFLYGSSTSNIGIRLRSVNGGEFSRLFFTRFQDNALLQDAGVDCEFNRLGGYNCLLDRTQAAKIGVFDIAGTDHRVNDVEFTASLTGRSDANLYLCGIVIRGANHFIRSAVGHTSDIGIHVACTTTSFDQPRAMENFGHGIEFGTGGGCQLIAGKSIDNSQHAANTYSGYYTGTSQSNVLIGCRALTGGHKYGFEDTGSYAAVESRNVFVGCRSSEHDTAAFYVEATNSIGSTPDFPSQALRATDGDTTPSVAQTSLLDLRSYTGATTITQFDDGVHGQGIDVVGSANVTIQNNGSVKTNTGADKTLAANTIYSFRKIGGVWMERE
jgi:hypothetical protein